MMNDQHLTRRNLLTQTLPVAALGAGLLSTVAFAQQGGAAAGKGGGAIEQALAAAFADGQYQLPKLPYAYDALEPHIDAKTVQLHHDKHHKAYVDGLNKALKGLADLRQAGGEVDMPKLYGLERDLSFNGGGHVLHTLFWATMGPQAGGAPQGALAEAINTSFGSFDAFKAYFSKVAAGIKGSGWALLAYEPVGRTLNVYGINEHDAHLIPGSIILLPLDVWEHAYYLKYQNVRAEFIAAWWNVVNWAAVGEFFERVQAGHKSVGGKK
jgi:Fe-Mn family superoxide dismutase